MELSAIRAPIALAATSLALPASAHGGELFVVASLAFALLLGAIPGVWAGARGHERSRGHPWLIAIVAIVAIGGVFLYTVGGGSDELFTRIVVLPLSLVIAVAMSAVLIGAPMYVGYILGYRIAAFRKNPK